MLANIWHSPAPRSTQHSLTLACAFSLAKLYYDRSSKYNICCAYVQLLLSKRTQIFLLRIVYIIKKIARCGDDLIFRYVADYNLVRAYVQASRQLLNVMKKWRFVFNAVRAINSAEI